jgi:hypothetical protein
VSASCKPPAAGSDRQQTPYRRQSRNHGLFASAVSCLRFAAEISLGVSGRASGSAKIRSSRSISAMVFSASIQPNIGHNHACGQVESSVEDSAACSSTLRPPFYFMLEKLTSVVGIFHQLTIWLSLVAGQRKGSDHDTATYLRAGCAFCIRDMDGVEQNLVIA